MQSSRPHALRRWTVQLCLLMLLPLSLQAAPPAAIKVLRLPLEQAETSFDPVRADDVYSLRVLSHVLEALYHYDYLARPAKLVPLTAAALPEVAEDYKRWTIRLRPGIFFADDPAFGGKPRELVAADYVYSFKRYADPALSSPRFAEWLEAGIVGLQGLREEALRSGKPMDYGREIAGLRALDRYTLQIRLAEPRPRFAQWLAGNDKAGALAAEVVQAYGAQIGEHPVGTGPFRLAEWRRSSRLVLERNPGYRERYYDAEPAPDDAEGQALLARFKGRRLPMVDRVELSVIVQNQPRWLAFLNGELDLIEVPGDFMPKAVPLGRLAPHLRQRGIRLYRSQKADVTYMYFNMRSPALGGNAPDKVALRRAIGLGLDVAREIRLTRGGQAILAQSGVVPFTSGYDERFRSESGEHDPAKARALLDTYGYRDRDGDGWREQPDGSPLVLEIATQPDDFSRAQDELRKKDLDALGLRTRFVTAQWPEQLKAARAGRLMIWQLSETAVNPDGQDLGMRKLYGPEAGSTNLSYFRLPAFDALYERVTRLPDGPEREAALHEAKRLQVAYMPLKYMTHRIGNELTQPRLQGYRRGLFSQELWHYVDLAP